MARKSGAKRTNTLHLKLTEAERADFDAKAEAAGLATSAWLRSLGRSAVASGSNPDSWRK